MDNLTMIWEEVVNMLDLDLNPIQLKNWIKPLSPLAMKGQVLIVDCQSSFIRTMVEKKYLSTIESYLSYICESPMQVQLIDPSEAQYFPLRNQRQTQVGAGQPGHGGAAGTGGAGGAGSANSLGNDGPTSQADSGRPSPLEGGQAGQAGSGLAASLSESSFPQANPVDPTGQEQTSFFDQIEGGPAATATSSQGLFGPNPVDNPATANTATPPAAANTATNPAAASPASEDPSQALAQRIEEKKRLREKQQKRNGYMTLNPKYTLESFVQGKSNDFAYAAAQAVVAHPGTIYNPLFIYGGSGLGKTHLMQGIAHSILKQDPNKTVLYITSENFMNEMIAMIENGTHTEKENFRQKYRSIDVLLIDDIQFIAGKKATMEEIFHTFNHLKEANHQIVLSSDKPPQELKNLEERLVTRFEGGMTVDIQKPDFETRVAILKHKMKGESLELPDYVLSFIAENITSNIRELEGSLLRVIAYFVYKKVDPATASRDQNMLLAREAMKIEEEREREIAIEDIIDRVTEYYNLESNAITGKSRQSAIALPRQIAMYLARQLTNESLVSIGRSFARDHTTVMHALDKVESLMQSDDKVKSDVELLSDQLKHG